LQGADTIIGIVGGLGQGADVRLQAVGDGQAGSIIGALLMREPDESWNSTLCRLVLVIFSWFSAVNPAMLFRIPTGIVSHSFWGTIFRFS
jgi:hypothetical protein